MHPLAFLRRLLQGDDNRCTDGCTKRGRFLVAFLVAVLCLLLSQPLSLVDLLQANAQGLGSTAATLNPNCDQLSFSADGNPFALCPGPFPRGGNCVWWAWEQWHWLHYDLPLNWGNAADWVSAAQRTGLSVGTRPRVGAIAVFPVADGVWAYSSAGHVAFVTWVSSDGDTFNVTYQNYGDPTPVHLGIGYHVSVINQPRYQRGQLRFIYFPGQIDPQLFERLPGVDGESLAQVMETNQQQQSDPATLTSARLALGLPPTSSEQDFNADFTGSGQSDLLLYNRQEGTLKVLQLLNTEQLSKRPGGRLWPYPDSPTASSGALAGARLVTLADHQVGPRAWGSDLDIRIGDFAGLGHAQILLYSRSSGKIQILSLGPDLQINQHITLTGWGPGWEVYTGRFDGQRTDLLLYNRFINTPTPTIPAPSLTPTPFPTVPGGPSTSPVPTLVPTKTPTPSATPRPTATAKPTATATPKPTATPSPTATPRPTAT
ncbi:CHAP domain-containing protein, partial [Thermogemmatispora sp.]|uniref:CHAP domain-containing protein n=1 Tax=Thermogemmatispora sp. TaxID=1968838 RepID=UPI0035E42326